MARHAKKRKIGRNTVWITLIIFCLAAFILGYIYTISGYSF